MNSWEKNDWKLLGVGYDAVLTDPNWERVRYMVLHDGYSFSVGMLSRTLSVESSFI